MKRPVLIALMTAAIVASGVAARSTDLTLVNVTSSGTSLTRDGAITDALVNAINEVNGRVIDEQTLVLSLRAGLRVTSPHQGSPTTGTPAQTNTVNVSSNAYVRFIEAETHGAVHSYSVLDVTQNTSGTWTAKVDALIAKFTAPKQALRRSIAVLPTAVSSREAFVDGRRIASGGAAELFGEALINGLTSTRRFTVLDRKHSAALDRELATIRSGQASVSDYALLGHRLVADYVLITKLNHFEFKVFVTRFPGTSRTIRSGRGEADVAYELIDPVTSQVIESATLRNVVSEAALRRLGPLSSPTDIAQALASYIGRSITKAITADLYPIMIVDASGNNVVIAEGASVVRDGVTYGVFEYGKQVEDPYTGENLGREQIYCCRVRITRVTQNLAYGTISGSQSAFQDIFKPESFILGGSVVVYHADHEQSKAKAIQQLIKQQNSVFDESDQ
jgi:curli biogenesis system outer membrane secretion channel CsgG